jgi:hypothetical protein
MIILKIYEDHYLTLTAGPNLTPIKEKTQSKGYFSRHFIRTLTKTAKETFCYGVVLLQETFCMCAFYILIMCYFHCSH